MDLWNQKIEWFGWGFEALRGWCLENLFMFLDSNDSDVKVDAGSSFNKKVCFLLI